MPVNKQYQRIRDSETGLTGINIPKINKKRLKRNFELNALETLIFQRF